MKINRVKVGTLNSDPANVRKHDAKNLEAIKGSLKRFGQQKPIVIDGDGIVRAGNGTLEAARALGWTHIDTVRTGLEGSDATAYAIADNRTAELADWDDSALAETLAALQNEEGFDHLAAGFSDAEIEQLVSDAVGLTDIVEDEVPEPPADPVTKTGDLITLGGHRLLCGDSTKAEDVARLMDGEKADMMQTDPPYGVDYSGQSESMSYGGSSGKPREKIEGDSNAEVAADIMSAAFKLNQCAIAFVWAAPQYHDLAKEALMGCGYNLFSLIVWNKNHANFGAMGATYKPKYEMALACNIKGIPFFGPNNETTVWDCDRSAVNKLHPTQKPIELFARAIKNHTKASGSVYDPFLGSGTTLIAAEQLGRKCYGIEISPAYCDVIVTRWEILTGKQATRKSNG